MGLEGLLEGLLEEPSEAGVEAVAAVRELSEGRPLGDARDE